MSSSYGENLHLTIFGQSHSAAVGMTLEGIPAGQELDADALQRFLDRRAPGRNAWSSARREADIPEFLSGLHNGISCGTPITAILRNTDTRSQDYTAFADVPRPGHADFTAHIKFGGWQDCAGSGHFSGRLTAPLCVAGGICLQILAREGITIISRISRIADVTDDAPLAESTAEKDFPVVDDSCGEEMKQRIAQAKAEGDSVGGIVECAVLGLPAGLGEPMFDGMENRIAQIVFGIPAVKGLEFGAGFTVARMRGSECNDPFVVRNGRIETDGNNCGGILGGISNGMPLVFKVAFKPTPSIARTQKSVNMKTMEAAELTIGGRHDPCIVPRAVPVVEAAAAIAVYDALLGRRKDERL